MISARTSQNGRRVNTTSARTLGVVIAAADRCWWAALSVGPVARWFTVALLAMPTPLSVTEIHHMTTH